MEIDGIASQKGLNDSGEAIDRHEGNFCIDSFRPADAEGIVKLFQATYGEHYPIRLFYEPEELITANRDGRCFTAVARNNAGRVIGASHIYRSAPYAGLYENGAAIVLEEYRNAKIITGIMSCLFNEITPRRREVEELWAETVCNHLFTQKLALTFPGIDTAIEVALMPAETYGRERNAFGRVATVNFFRCYVSKPHRIFFPPAYEAVLQGIYGRLDDHRELAVAAAPLPASKTTTAELKVFHSAVVARINIPMTGDDFGACISVLEAQARKEQAIVFQAFLNLSEPWIGAAVDILRKRGYFFGGAMPRWFDGDGLLMQKLACPPNFENIALFLDSSKELLAFIQQDWECAVRS